MLTRCLITLFRVVVMFQMLHTFTHAQDSGDRYRKVATSMLQTTFQTETAVSRITCCAYCSDSSECESVNYKSSSQECQLSSVPFVHVTDDIVPSAEWNVYNKISEWLLVFRGTPGSGVDAYAAWVYGTSTTTDDVTCKKLHDTTCTQNYRSLIVDSWNDLSISKVKYSLYNNGLEVAYVTFNGTGSDVIDWFSQEKILESSWSDLDTETYNYFSIVGHDPGRRFFICRSYGGCSGDLAYTVAVASVAFSCEFDQQSSYPQFLYASSTSYDNIQNFVYADLMAIHIMN